MMVVGSRGAGGHFGKSSCVRTGPAFPVDFPSLPDTCESSSSGQQQHAQYGAILSGWPARHHRGWCCSLHSWSSSFATSLHAADCSQHGSHSLKPQQQHPCSPTPAPHLFLGQRPHGGQDQFQKPHPSHSQVFCKEASRIT